MTPNNGVYEISSGAELAWFASQVNDGTGKDYDARLTGDIDLGGELWTPIGNSSFKPYAGVFDGGGYTVSGLNVSNEAYAGLFGYVKGTSGDLAEVKNLVVQGSVSGTDKAGGIAGQADYASFTNCGSEATVSGKRPAASSDASTVTAVRLPSPAATTRARWTAPPGAGGIMGYVNDKAAISDCYNNGPVTGGSYAGGLRGMGGQLCGGHHEQLQRRPGHRRHLGGHRRGRCQR